MAEHTARTWVRLSWRDLRSRWLVVGAIAAIIAFGTGTYAGLGSTATWRRESNDASFALLHMHDLRVSLAQGASVEQGKLEMAVRGIPHASWIASTEERLIGVTQVDASSDDQTVLVPGQLVGVDVTHGPLTVDALHNFGGRSLEASDDRRAVGLLEHQFAKHYHLPDTGHLTLSGGSALDYVGVATSPEYFIVSSRTASIFAQANLAVVFVPLTTAQRLLDRVGQVNEIAIALTPGADRATVEREISASLDVAGSAGGGNATTTTREDEPAWRMLYNDIDNDQQFWNIVAGLILLGATFAAFNLVSRIVESQRREIGIGMALGVSPARLAIRPMLVGAQIAVLGVVGGVAVGALLDLWLESVFQSVLPMPVFRASFQTGVFARAALLGFVLPLLGTAIPVRRAVRAQPVDAIRTGHLAAQGSHRTRLSWLPLPGRSYRRMPIRNLVRTPRRTLLTALAIGASITTLIAIIGMVDSFVRTMDNADAEATRGARQRVQVELDTFYPQNAPEVASIAAAPEVGTAEAALRLFGTASAHGHSVDLVTDLLDFHHASWLPTLESGTAEEVRQGGIVLSRKAAADLAVKPGDHIEFRHPRRAGTTYSMVNSDLVVSAVHPSPMRVFAYLDIGRAPLFNLVGVTNLVDTSPVDGVTEAQLQRALFDLPGVASVQSVTASTQMFKDALDEYFGVLRVAELIVLVLALLIAFNSTSISVDERARENATMLAFGLRPRTVLTVTTVETVFTGALGTALGVVAGRVVLGWMMSSQLDKTVPDLGVVPYVSATTLATAVLLGVVAVAVAPLLVSKRVRRLDIPSTLRVVE
jgi:putative ABC transport system permease protein